MGGVADKLSNLVLAFPARTGETGKLYGSISSQMIAEAIEEKTSIKLDRRQVDTQPIRSLGDYRVPVRLTMDLVPEVRVVVYREGEKPDLGEARVEVAEPVAEQVVEPEAEVAAEE
jgi:large subunit ribosomal protein L9